MALIPLEILGTVVNELRARRARGVRASELVRFVDELGIYKAFGFVIPGSFHFHLHDDGLDYEAIGFIADPLIDAARARWTTAPPYPDLASRRDREAFRAVAKRRRVYLLVSNGDADAVRGPT